MVSHSWHHFSESLADCAQEPGSYRRCGVPQCTPDWKKYIDKNATRSRYCFWNTVESDEEGDTYFRWQPPGLRELSASEARSCFQNKWLLFIGPSHMRLLYYSLLRLHGHSISPVLPNKPSGWPRFYGNLNKPNGTSITADSLGECTGSLNATIMDDIVWNVSSSGEDRTGGCTRDLHIDNIQYSFFFLDRISTKWGALCALVRSFERRQPDAIILEYGTWPNMFGDQSTGPCNHTQYRSDIHYLFELLALRRMPPEGVTTAKMCKHRHRRHWSTAPPPAAPPPLSPPPPPPFFYYGQSRMVVSMFRICLASKNAEWWKIQTQALAKIKAEVARVTGAHTPWLHRLMTFQMVEGYDQCSGTKCLERPSPHMMDGTHMGMPVYTAIAHSLQTSLCGMASSVRDGAA